MKLNLLNLLDKRYILLTYNEVLSLLFPYHDSTVSSYVYKYQLSGFERLPNLDFKLLPNYPITFIESKERAVFLLSSQQRLFLESYVLCELVNLEFTGNFEIL